MQNTRLTNLFIILSTRINELFSNPWRRIALIIISLLLGFFAASAVTSTAGQDATWDVVAAASVIVFTELVSFFAYSNSTPRTLLLGVKRSLAKDVINTFRIGFTYGMFLEAFKLNS